MTNRTASGQRDRAGVLEIQSPSGPDLGVSFHGSVVLFHSLSDAGREWCSEHCPPGNDHQYFGRALVVEPRYVESLLAHLAGDGLVAGNLPKGGI
jgi:hypothetical protein